jgi:16S rRNA (guanine(966)-N(2))-methyltransferase RsmD
MIGGFMDGTLVLDLFAGTGGLGLEALSRGALRCCFCDNSRESLALLERNIARCRMGERSEILNCGFERALSSASLRADVIFMDPPYHDNYYERCLELIMLNGILLDGGVIVVEHDAKLPPREPGECLRVVRRKSYGGSGVTVFTAEKDWTGTCQ